MYDFTHGKATFGLDARFPYMKYAAITLCLATFGTVRSVDDSDARSLFGVEGVIQLDRMKTAPGAQFYGMLGVRLLLPTIVGLLLKERIV